MNRFLHRSSLSMAIFALFLGTFTLNCGRPERVSAADECRGQDCDSNAGASFACVETTDCGEFQICDQGQCIDESQIDSCESSNECPFGQFCDLAFNACVDCLMDDHCEVGLVCQADGTCGDGSVECATDYDCPTGYVCDDLGQCVSGGSTGGGQDIPCASQADCEVYGRICENNICVPCTADSQCQAGYVCSAGTCTDPSSGGGGGGGGLPGGGCTSAYDCPEGQGCFMGLMCGFCMVDTDCRDEETCDTASLQCISGSGSGGGGDGGAGGCTDAYDCAAGEGCLMGMCGFCMADTDCRSDETCDPGSLSCQ